MLKEKHWKGFTLVEIMIVVAILGLLVTLGVPGFLHLRNKAVATKTAADLKLYSDAFQIYNIHEGSYPPDTHLVLPTGMENYIAPYTWEKGTMKGEYNWEGPDSYPYAGIALFDIEVNIDQLEILDEKIDDGDLSTGSFRLIASNGRYTYIIQE